MTSVGEETQTQTDRQRITHRKAEEHIKQRSNRNTEKHRTERQGETEGNAGDMERHRLIKKHPT